MPYSPIKGFMYNLFLFEKILSMALITNSYMDWWNERLQLMTAVVIPSVMYVIGGLLYKKNIRFIAVSIVALGSAVVAIYMIGISISSDIFKYGYYVEPFTGNAAEKSVFVGLLIIPAAVLVGLVLYYFKLNKLVTASVVTVVTGITMLPLIRDGRLVFIKEAFRLQMNLSSGLQWISSKENYLNIRTSHCMWLDFARDYGMVALGLLAVFEIWSIYCFVRMLLEKNKNAVQYILIVAFVLFNFHFMFEATAIDSKYIFALGLFVYGLVTAEVGWGEN